MGPRGIVIAGLLAGIATTAVVLVGAVFLLPEPPATVDASPTPSATASIVPTDSVTGSGPASPAASPSVAASIGRTAFHVGEHAPDLSVSQLGGGNISLAALAGHPVWVNFMQTTCPPCIDEFPVMSGFAARYAATGLVVVAVDVREDEGTIASFVQSLNASFPVGLDTTGSVAQAWDAVALPVHFWIDRDGIIRAGALGGIGPDAMAANLQVILPDVTVTP